MTNAETQPTSQPPALWNPNAAACWSLLFSPVFGAFIHAQNAEALGRVEEAKSNRVWFYVSIGFYAVVCLTTFVPVIPDGLLRVAGLALLLGWYFSLGRKQIAYVKETWRDGYERKPWKKPLLVAFGSLFGLSAVTIVLTMASEIVFHAGRN